MSFLGFFKTLEQEVVGFFEKHGQQAILNAAQKIVPAVEADVKKVLAGAEAKAETVLPVVETFLLKHIPDDAAEIKSFLVSIEPLIAVDLSLVYQRVAQFVISKLSGSNITHLINLAIEYVLALVVKV